MSETPVEHQTIIDKPHEEPIGAAQAPAPRSRSLEAGGAFLKALAADLGAAAARLRRRRPQPAQTPSPVSSGPGIGRALWRISMVFLGVVLICSGLLSAAMLWVIFGSPLEPRHSDPGIPQLRAEATNDVSLSRNGAVATAPIQPGTSSAAAEQQKPAEQTMVEAKAAPNPPQPAQPGGSPVAEAGSQPGSTPAAAEQQKPTEETTAEAQAGSNHAQPAGSNVEPAAETPIQPGPPSAGGAGQPKPVEETKAEVQAGSNQPQPAGAEAPAPGPGAEQQEITAKLTDQHPGMPCNVDLCAATYKSFHTADCTYQPIGGGSRSLCELGAQAAGTSPQPTRVATDPSPKPTDAPPAAPMQSIAQSAALDRTGSQCNRALCASTYKSFHAADCTYQPEGGGARSVCELSKGPADAPPQPLHAATDARRSAPEATPEADDDMPDAGMVQEIAGQATPDQDGPQCNRSRCAATYQSFHAADCTYQPAGGGPRRICEP